MPVIQTPAEFNVSDLYVDLRRCLGVPLYLKCEGFNFAGSVKLKAASAMVRDAEERGLLRPGDTIVESSSGNLGVALSVIAAARGYRFVCVTDPRCNLATRRLVKALGGEVRVVDRPHDEGGFLAARIALVRSLADSGERMVWLNQYANPGNWRAHHATTAEEIARQFPGVDVVFVGAGTTGTLMGCARFFRSFHRPVTVVGVDSVGSVTFGGPPSRRTIPGLGAGVRPPLLDERWIDDVVMVPEAETLRFCHRLVRGGFLFGGSTGTVVAGAARWLAEHDPQDRMTAVAISPDLGERYLDTVYHDHWLREVHPGVLDDVVRDGMPRETGIPAV
ncbi:cysteine synthase A [Marinactinospora thermotolerans DSM 45154]|uniref:Cysteine synthase A n=1 Tax=Marinactinospora thermotolerans DSM 45154 TaxID=1122192 RepID=A0A1T4RCG6_9ACTN|nr:2,3-diaminopropionate biosynthesis protein SbnA [Marinactinospora thermotolerans]SKA13321.1 cysteine synthase A [Marinactinospora thermotolerans DSM 45154]